jgi:hypothetical protein
MPAKRRIQITAGVQASPAKINKAHTYSEIYGYMKKHHIIRA